jgi:hypothetical protein
MAYAGHVFTNRLLHAMGGDKNVIENTFVENNLTKAPFFSTPVSFLGLVFFRMFSYPSFFLFLSFSLLVVC